jgi:hypothetical protein
MAFDDMPRSTSRTPVFIALAIAIVLAIGALAGGWRTIRSRAAESVSSSEGQRIVQAVIDQQQAEQMRQSEQVAQQLDATDKQMQRTERQLERNDQQLQRQEALLLRNERQADRLEALLTHQEKQAERYDRLLDRWEAEGRAAR